MSFDGLLYMMGMPMLVITLGLLVLNFAIFAAHGMTTAALIWNYVRYIIATFLLPPLTAILILWLDKRPIKPMIKGIVCYPLFLGSWIAINIKALIKPDTTWTKIEHTRSVKVNELSNQ